MLVLEAIENSTDLQNIFYESYNTHSKKDKMIVGIIEKIVKTSSLRGFFDAEILLWLYLL